MRTRNTFCGTQYLPYSQVHNDRTVPIIMARFIAHARNGRISTSGLKSDVTVVFLDPISYNTHAEMSAIRVYLRQIWDYLIFAWIFRTFWPKMEVFGGMGMGWCDTDPNELVFTFGGSYACAIFL